MKLPRHILVLGSGPVNEMSWGDLGSVRPRPIITRVTSARAALRRGEPGDLLVVMTIDALGSTTDQALEMAGKLTDAGLRTRILAPPLNEEQISALAAVGKGLMRDDRARRQAKIRAGLRRARGHGVRLGGRRIPMNLDEARELRSRGMSLRHLATRLGVSVRTLRRRLAESDGQP